MLKYKIVTVKKVERMRYLDSWHVKEWYSVRKRFLFFFWEEVKLMETKEMAQSYIIACLEGETE
jgi:hypothetical protein